MEYLNVKDIISELLVDGQIIVVEIVKEINAKNVWCDFFME